jgi:hypothetical protein
MENYNRVEKDEYDIYYYLNYKLHRLDGPAVKYSNGDKEWWYNGLRHRIDGPAIEYIDGYKEWYQNGLLHRIDGPAVEWEDGDKCWYYEDKYIDCNSQEEFERYIKLKLFW